MRQHNGDSFLLWPELLVNIGLATGIGRGVTELVHCWLCRPVQPQSHLNSGKSSPLAAMHIQPYVTLSSQQQAQQSADAQDRKQDTLWETRSCSLFWQRPLWQCNGAVWSPKLSLPPTPNTSHPLLPEAGLLGQTSSS